MARRVANLQLTDQVEKVDYYARRTKGIRMTTSLLNSRAQRIKAQFRHVGLEDITLITPTAQGFGGARVNTFALSYSGGMFSVLVLLLPESALADRFRFC